MLPAPKAWAGLASKITPMAQRRKIFDIVAAILVGLAGYASPR